MDISSTEIKVRGYHLDVYQHVNNARYLEFLEEARWNHYQDYPPSYFVDKGWGVIIVNININYKFPAVLGDTLDVQTSLIKIGKSSITFQQEIEIKESNKIAVSAEVTFVIINLKTNKILPIEGDIEEVLTRTKK
ncbi:MAG: acyl-CoA thioesterase [Crocinitomicaceae bacterium]|jgi:thioesterase III|nr:acyl-CoA thioesterase [Crocinitomicaceae bacterium]MBT5403719.1 acyl-CoA thioesterase [Crocinitomicaceae bacterium]MBT6514379.1 acyl-CoA thioesterase [Crocinitomicaceae bacterium]